MSKINPNSHSVNSSGGAFKKVEIFEHYVRKIAREEQFTTYKMSDTRAYENGYFRDKDGKFHPSWNQTEYIGDSQYGRQEDCDLEMYHEFTFANRKKHLPFVIPVLEGDENCYVMPRAKVKEDLDVNLYKLSEKPYVKRRLKKIKLTVLNKINRAGINLTMPQFTYRCDNIVEFGIAAGLTDKKIINNLFWFVMEDFYSGIIGDMHFSNLGIYRGNVVAIDMGQISDYHFRNPRKRYRKRSLSYRV